MNKNPIIPDNIYNYVNEVITRENDVQRRLREETQRLPGHISVMQTTPDQVTFLGLLIKLMGAKNVLEIGTFTGYSALGMALALPNDGKLIACDMSREWTDIAKRYWQEAGVSDRIELRLGDAKKTLGALSDQSGSFDFAFIDADKKAYDFYYETCLTLVRPGGAIAFDNMLWGGAVADSSDNSAETSSIRNLNAKIRDDSRVDASLLTITDGIMLVRKK